MGSTPASLQAVWSAVLTLSTFFGAVIRNEVGLWPRVARVEPFPPPQVGEQSRRQFHGGLALGRLNVAFRMTMEHAVDGIDERQARTLAPCGVEDRARPTAGVDADEEHADQVAQGAFVCRLPLLNLSVAPARPQEPRDLRSREPSLTRLPSRGQRDSDDATVKTFFRMVADRRGEVLKIAARPTV